jgi:hypothetical protein
VDVFPSTWAVTVDPAVHIVDPADGAGGGVVTAPAPPSDHFGTASGDFGPSFVCLLLQGNTGSFVGARQVRSRNFIGPLAGAVSSVSLPVSSGAFSELESAANTWMFDNAAVRPVVWRRPKVGTSGAAVDVTGFTVSPRFASLRSRRD